MIEIFRKQIDAEIEKGADGSSPVVITATTGAEDRDGDIIDPKGWDIGDYEKNPVILWAHNQGSLPIGVAEKIKSTAKGISITVKFASHQAAKDIETAVREGIVRGVSVGFRPTSMPELRPGGGLKFVGQKLLEVSLVPVPSNADALVQSKAARDEVYKSLSSILTPPAASAAQPPPQAALVEETHMSEKTEAAPVVPVVDIKAEIAAAVKSAFAEFAKANISDPTAKAVDAASKAPAFIRSTPTQKIAAGPEKSNVLLGRVGIAAARAKQIGCSVKDALEMSGNRQTADKMEREEADRKALGVSSISAGAAVVPEDNAGQMVELLAAQSVLIGAPGVMMLYPTTDTVRIPRQTGGATASYIGEAKDITPSTQTFDEIVMQMKKLAALTVVSNEFLADASLDAEAFIGNDLIRSAALKMDYTAFYGAGTVYTPKGIFLWASSGQVHQQTAATYAGWITDLNRTVSELETANVPLNGSMYFMNPQIKNGLFGLQDTLGSFQFRDEMRMAGTLNGFPFRVTSQITSGSAVTNKVAFVNLPNFVVALRKQFEISVGETWDDAGTTKTGFSSDQSAIRLIGRHDFAMRHPQAASIIHTCTLT